MKYKRFGFFVLSVLAVFSFFVENASAQSYPNKPIHWIVPFTPGGATDTIARTIGQKLQDALGQPVIVENRPGAGGALGAEAAAKSPADGYTLFGGTISTHAINPALNSKLPYDPIKDFEPIALVGFNPNVLFVNPKLPINSIQDLVAYAKQHPGELTFGSAGNGTSQHLSGELFKLMTGINVTHVPYKGSPQALQDVVGGQVSFLFDQLAAGLELTKAGKLRAIAVTPLKRVAALPDVPTVAESGFPGFEVLSWQAVYAPAKTPKEVVNKLSVEIVKILNMPDVKERLGKIGIELAPGNAEDLAKHNKAEIEKWSKIVKESGTKI
jgi:tripartite-type tricarboxylate transporter receptor subunit TctC